MRCEESRESSGYNDGRARHRLEEEQSAAVVVDDAEEPPPPADTLSRVLLEDNDEKEGSARQLTAARVADVGALHHVDDHLRHVHRMVSDAL